mmetsp:Transcript_11216/g.26266  ORF Transcript_11216/g.26266 Transcript_11216/m.26266 type:complete len:199 (+) Transcript_11216:1044-1640(+)
MDGVQGGARAGLGGGPAAAGLLDLRSLLPGAADELGAAVARATTGVTVVGCVLKPSEVDAALLRPGRLDQMLRIGLPDEHSRAEVFRVHTCLLPLERDVDFSSLVATTAGLTPARIAWLCRRAALEAVRRAVDAAPAGTEVKRDAVRVRSTDFETALARCRHRAGFKFEAPGCALALKFGDFDASACDGTLLASERET